MCVVGVLPLPLALTDNMCTFLHKQIIGSGPNVLNINFLGEARNTRSTNSRVLEIERRTTNVARNSYLVRVAKLWNSLPQEIRITDSVSLFNRRLIVRAHLLENNNNNSGLRAF